MVLALREREKKKVAGWNGKDAHRLSEHLRLDHQVFDPMATASPLPFFLAYPQEQCELRPVPHLAEQIVWVELDRLVLHADRLYNLGGKLVEVATRLELGPAPRLGPNRKAHILFSDGD